MSTGTGEAPADLASRMTTPARVAESWATYLGFARKVTDRGPACESAATESTVAAGSPRSSQPNLTASSPSVTVMVAGSLESPRGASGLRGRLGRRRGRGSRAGRLGLQLGKHRRRDVD